MLSDSVLRAASRPRTALPRQSGARRAPDSLCLTFPRQQPARADQLWCVALVNKRRRLLNFLFREDVGRYKNLVQGLGIRHKPPSKVQSKDEAYGRFPQQKNLKGKSKMK